MNADIFSTNEPVTFEPYAAEESTELLTVEEDGALDPEEQLEDLTVSSGDAASSVSNTVIEIPDNLLTNDIYMSGVNDLVNAIDPDSVNEEVYYVDYGSFYSLGVDLPDYAVTYDCNGIEVVFPTEYAEQVFVVDGLLVNLGSNYTAGLQIDGYDVSNYLSSEITIPTYHSATWYQYQQSYGQPYRIVDRYVNNYGNISSSTRSSVSVEWSGGNPWEGFTFDRAAMFIIIAVLLVMLVFRKGKL